MDEILTHELNVLKLKYESLKNSFWARLKFLLFPSAARNFEDQLEALIDYQSLKGMIDIEVNRSPVNNTVSFKEN